MYLINKTAARHWFQKYTCIIPDEIRRQASALLTKNLITGTDLGSVKISEAVGYNQTRLLRGAIPAELRPPPLKYRKQFGDSSKV